MTKNYNTAAQLLVIYDKQQIANEYQEGEDLRKKRCSKRLWQQDISVKKVF